MFKSKTTYEVPRYVLFHIVGGERLELAKNTEIAPLERMRELFGSGEQYVIVDTKAPEPAKPARKHKKRAA